MAIIKPEGCNASLDHIYIVYTIWKFDTFDDILIFFRMNYVVAISQDFIAPSKLSLKISNVSMSPSFLEMIIPFP